MAVVRFAEDEMKKPNPLGSVMTEGPINLGVVIPSKDTGTKTFAVTPELRGMISGMVMPFAYKEAAKNIPG